MHLLVTNDDGYQTPGAIVPTKALALISEFCVVAPNRNRSGVNHSLTLDRLLRATQTDQWVCTDN
ncbi:MAG: hypothetical protein GY807_04090 [Gammaproteobacteria bacterium]|nr:hypothetical protein [Gammaproteobacteria bacterium]